jgi:hypothetical protein
MWQLTYAVYVFKDDLLFSCYFMGKLRTTEGNVELELYCSYLRYTPGKTRVSGNGRL